MQHLKDGDADFFNGKYKMIDGKFIIKNQMMPDSYNPFLKIQRYFIGTIKAALALFMAIYFYKQLIMGNMENFAKPENLPKLTFTLFKFAIVIWLTFYNGWQQGAYGYLVNFSTAGYSFVNNIFVKVMKNPKNQIINFAGGEKRLRVIQKDSITEEEEKVLLCFKYNVFDKITFAMRDFDRKCPRGFYSNYIVNSNYDEAVQIIVKKRTAKRQIEPNIVISNNVEISKLLYFVDDYNKTHQNKLRIEIKTGANSWGSHLDDGKLWEPNYDGCYFDTSEYKEDKNYLSMFDTLDCKLIRYLGYSTNNMAPNLILYSVIMLVPSFIFPDGLISNIISGIGAFLFGLMMTFIFIIFNIVIKVIYLFTSAFFTLSILIFLSPIILPLMFFERTKKVFDSWVENIMDVIFKPILNFALTIVYVNIMDIILLKNATFEKHSNIGRGAGLVCPQSASSFICLINGFPVVSQIKILFSAGLFNILIDVVIVFLFFQLSDTILEDLDKISSSIFRSITDTTKSSSSLLSPSTFGAKGVSDSVGSAMEAGKKLENFRTTYINNAPGAALEAVRRASAKAGETAAEGGNKKLATVLGAPAAFMDSVDNKKEMLKNKVASLKNKISNFAGDNAKTAKKKLKALGRQLLGMGKSKKDEKETNIRKTDRINAIIAGGSSGNISTPATNRTAATTGKGTSPASVYPIGASNTHLNQLSDSESLDKQQLSISNKEDTDYSGDISDTLSGGKRNSLKNQIKSAINPPAGKTIGENEDVDMDESSVSEEEGIIPGGIFPGEAEQHAAENRDRNKAKKKTKKKFKKKSDVGTTAPGDNLEEDYEKDKKVMRQDFTNEPTKNNKKEKEQKTKLNDE
jgi:hypothetical protein